MRVYMRTFKVNPLHDCITIVLGKELLMGGHPCPTDISSFTIMGPFKELCVWLCKCLSICQSINLKACLIDNWRTLRPTDVKLIRMLVHWYGGQGSWSGWRWTQTVVRLIPGERLDLPSSYLARRLVRTSKWSPVLLRSTGQGQGQYSLIDIWKA